MVESSVHFTWGALFVRHKVTWYVEHFISVWSLMRFLLGFNLQYKGSSLAHGTQSVPPLTLNQYFKHLSTSWSKHSCQEIGIVYCISIWKGGKKIEWGLTDRIWEREGKLMSEESQLRVGHKKVLAWVLPPIPQPYPGQSANKSACQHRWSRTALWGGETNTGR